MKKSTLLIALLLLNFSLIFSQANSDNLLWENDIKSIDFSGTLAIGNNVFAYGTKGMYFYSSDKGVGWEQKKVENASSIIKLLNIDNKIIGFTASGQLLQSEDFGKTWQISKLENVELICFVDTYLSNIYIRTNKSINLYNNKLELISSYKNDALNDFSIYEIESDVSSISSWHNIIFHKNELYFYIANNPKLYKININKFLNNEIKIDTITPCDTCQTGNIGDLSKYNNTITFYLSRFNDKYESRDYKYNLDSNSISENSYDEKRKYSGKYFNLNGINYRFYDFAPYWISNYPTNYFKLGVDILNTSDSLTNIGNSDFIGVNRSPVISDVSQVSDSTFIAVSGYKFLIISNDKCKTWNVISSRGDLAQSKPDLISKNYRYFANNLTNISSSIDNGLTYKFIERDLDDSELAKFYKNSQTKITAKYLDTNGTFIYLMTSNLSNYNNIAVSKDYGKTATYFKNNSVASSTSEVINFSKIDNKLIYLFNYQTINKNYFIYCNFDLNMNITRRIVDSIDRAKFISMKNLNEGFMITTISNPTPTRIEALTWNAKDSNWIRSKFLDLVYTDLKVFSFGKNKDSAIVCVINFNGGISNNKIYIYDNINKNFELVFEKTLAGDPQSILEFDNKIYLVGMNFKIEANKHNLKAWKEYPINDNVSWEWVQKYTDGEKYIAKLINYKTNVSNVYNISLDPKSDIEIQPNEQTAFYSYPPFPTPSKNEVKSLIYWDMSYNIDDSDIGVYDIYGNKVADKDKISINKLNTYSGYLSWDCSGAGTGVYMIQIKHGTNTHNFRAIVVR